MSAMLIWFRRLVDLGPPGDPPEEEGTPGQWDFSSADQSGHLWTAGLL